MILLENEVTISDFITALEEEEVKELSNLFDPCGNLIDGTKIQYALDRAHEEVNSSFVITGNCGKALVKLNAKNMIIAIARDLLDTVKARPHVKEDADRAREKLKEFGVYDDNHNCPLSDEDLEEILGAPAPIVDDGFRFTSSKRRWDKGSFRDHQKRLFDRRTGSSGTDRINKTYWHDDIPE